MDKFFGRRDELEMLREMLGRSSASVMIYGKRKVGKTTLLKYVLENDDAPFIYYECLKSSLSDNVNGFVAELVRQKVLPVSLSFHSFVDVFAYLSSLGKTLNVAIDEYPYLKELTKAEIVDSQFQAIIDNYIGNIRLFLSGSHIGMMKDMLAEKNALYGRFSLTLHLKELNYKEAAEFYSELPPYDSVALYSVFGGSPFVNSFIHPSKTLKENIRDTVLNPFCPVSTYAEHLLISDYSNTVNAERILYAIANGKKKYGEIEDILGMKGNGLLSKQISTLLKMEIITKSYPINRPDDRKKISYEISDNLLRFYYTYIYKNKSALAMLGADAFYEEYIEKSIITFISHRFEEICRTYFSLQVKNGMLRGIANIGTYYYDDSQTHTNGEFDVVLSRRNEYDIYEVKYYSSKLSAKEMQAEAQKILNVKGLTPGKIGFVSISGYENLDEGYDLIDGEMLYR